MFGWWTVLIPLLIYLLYMWLKPWIRTTILAYSLPGPPVSPVIGNVFNPSKDFGFLDFLSTAYVKYGPIVKGWVAVVPFIFVLDPKHVQVILGSSKSSEKNFLYSALKSFIGSGLATLNGKKWKSHRKHIQPFFHGNMLEECIPTFVECSQHMLRNLKHVERVKFTSAMNTYVMDTIFKVLLGISYDDAIATGKSPFVMKRNVALERFFKPWLLMNSIFKLLKGNEYDPYETLEEFVLKIAKSRNARKVSATNWNLLDFLYEVSKTDNNFRMEDVINEVCSFLLAGQDTTKITLAFSLYFLAKHQDVQEKVAQELNRVMKSSNTVNLDNLNQMKYLEQCVKESMRLSPPITIIGRKLLEDVKLGDCVLPAGCNIIISPYATHRIAEYYPDPEQFNPERFSEKSQEERHNYAYIAFSGGSRSCVASKFALLSMKTVLSIFLKNFKIYLESEDEPLLPTFRISLKAKGNIWLRLKPREVTYG